MSTVYAIFGIQKKLAFLFLLLFLSMAANEVYGQPGCNCTIQVSGQVRPASCSAVCDGSIFVSASGCIPPYTFVWNTGVTGSVLTGLCVGVYTVTVTDSSGCVVTATFQVGEAVRPTPFAGRDTTICQGQCVTLGQTRSSAVIIVRDTLVSSGTIGSVSQTSPLQLSYLWSPATGLSCTTCPNPIACPTTTQVYTVTIDDSSGCPPLTAQVTVTVIPANAVAGCTSIPAPVAGVINVCKNQPVYFLDQSTGITAWNWSFGDGFFSSQQNPVHAYALGGTYTVTLTATSLCNPPQVLTKTVVVSSLPGPDIQCPSAVCAGDTTVYSTSAVCSNYNWSVAGGTIISSPLNSNAIMVVWGNPSSGYGTVSLSVPGCPGFCNNPSIALVPIVPPTLLINGPTIVCAGNSAVYSVPCIAGTAYNWTVPSPGQLLSGQGTPQITVLWPVTAVGITNISLNYNNPLAGCAGTGTIAVNVLPNLGVTGPAALCVNEVNSTSPFNCFNVTTLAPALANWSVVTPANVTLSNLQTSSSVFNTYNWNAGPGTYTVIAKNLSGTFCDSIATTTVQIISAPPQPSPIVGDATICPGGTYTYSVNPNTLGVDYSWTITGGSPSSATGPSVAVTWNPSGPYSISLTQQFSTVPFCISVPRVLTVTAFPPLVVPVISGPASVCALGTYNYTFSGTPAPGTTYTWSVSPGSAGSVVSGNGGSPVSIQFAFVAAPTAVNVVLDVAGPCSTAQVTYPVIVNPNPVAGITGPFAICQGGTAAFTGSGGGSYSWSFSGGSPSSSANASENVTYNTPGTFPVSLTVTDANGCTNTASTNITVFPVPASPVISGSLVICAGGVTTLTAPAAATYLWSPGGATTPSITVSTAGSYSVAMTTIDGCPFSAGPVNVVVNPLPSAVITGPFSGCVGQSITFTSPSTGTLQWSFEGIGYQASPTHTFATAGTHTVQLKVTDGNGCVAETSILVNIKPLPIAKITSADPTSFCNIPVNATLYALDGPGYTFLWSGPGSFSSTSSTVVATSPGTYTVTVTASGCSAVSPPHVITQIIGSCGTPGICTPSPRDFSFVLVGCSTVNFNSSSFGGFIGLPNWNFDDGSFSNLADPTHDFTIPGVYNVILSGLVPGIDTSGAVCTTSVAVQHPVMIPIIARFGTEYFCSGSGTIVTQFTDLSNFFGTNVVDMWSWSFDDPPSGASNTSSLQNPSHIFTSPGTYNVSLTITSSSSGATCTVVTAVVVPAPSAANFNFPSPACEGLPVNFVNTSSGTGNSYLWDFFNDGVFTSTVANASFAYPSAGSFSVKLTVYDIYGCNNSLVQPITVVAPSAVSITPSGPLTFCAGGSVTLTATGVVGTYAWNTSPVQTTSSIVVTQSGVYTVTVTPPGGCPSIAAPVTVIVVPLPSAVITGPTSYCVGGFLNLSTALGPFSYQWLYNGSPLTGETASSLTTALTGTGQSGNYQVVVTSLASPFCSDTSAAVVVTVNPNPVASISAPSTICQGTTAQFNDNSTGGPVAWLWNFGDPGSGASNTSTLQNPTHTYSQAGNYTVTLTVTNAEGCSNSVNAGIAVHPVPPAPIEGEHIYCAGETIILQTATGFSYQWQFDDLPLGGGYVPVGPNSPTLVVPNSIPSFSGNVQVVVTNSFGCSTTSAPFLITVNPSPAVPLLIYVGPAVLCAGSPVTISVSNPQSGVSYLWNTGQVGTSIVAANAGSYFVTASNSFGCSNTSAPIVIHPVPDLSCVPTGCYELCDSLAPITVPGPSGYAGYEWQQLIGNIYVTVGNEQNLVVTQSGTYHLVLTNSFGCSATSDPLYITFIPCVCTLSVSVSTIPSCPGGSNGVITATPSGGTGPFAFFLNTVPRINPITGLAAGGYTVSVRDAKGCYASTTATVGTVQIVITPTPTNVNCFGGCNGSISINVTGGTPGYTFSWSNLTTGQNGFATTQNVSNLCPGVYKVTVTDSRGCVAMATVTILTAPCSGFKTFTQGGWGAPPQGNNPGSYLHQRFAAAFPGGLTVGCTKKLKLTSAQAVTNFLPSGGTPSALTSNLTNPTTYSNTLAGQVVTLKLTLGFDAYDPNFSPSTTLIRNLIIGSGTFTGWTVGQLLAEGERVLGGCSSPYSASQLNNAIDQVNNNYDGGTMNLGYLFCPCNGTPKDEEASASAANVFQLEAFPNPFGSATTLRFSVPVDGPANLLVIDGMGREVAVLYNRNAKAGQEYEVQFSGKDLSKGIYIARLQSADGETRVMKLMLQ